MCNLLGLSYSYRSVMFVQEWFSSVLTLFRIVVESAPYTLMDRYIGQIILFVRPQVAMTAAALQIHCNLVANLLYWCNLQSKSASRRCRISLVVGWVVSTGLPHDNDHFRIYRSCCSCSRRKWRSGWRSEWTDGLIDVIVSPTDRQTNGQFARGSSAARRLASRERNIMLPRSLLLFISFLIRK